MKRSIGFKRLLNSERKLNTITVYDFVSMVCYSESLAYSLLNHELLNFETRTERRTWSLKNDWYKVSYKNIVFRVHEISYRIEISGSLHKYFEGGKTNWGEFSYWDARNTINELAEVFGFAPQQMKIHNIEFGINLKLPFDPDMYLTQLLAYKNQPFEDQYIRGKKSKYKIAGFSQYEIKAYNKSAQYSSALYPILRLEKRVTTMDCITWPEAITLATLQDIQFANYCFNELAKIPDLFLLSQVIRFNEMTGRECKTYQAATNMQGWKHISAVNRQRLRERLHKLIDRLRPGNERIKVTELLAAKHAQWKAEAERQ